jgi:hypothetical protein
MLAYLRREIYGRKKRATQGNRTLDLLFTKQLLWPAELGWLMEFFRQKAGRKQPLKGAQAKVVFLSGPVKRVESWILSDFF